MKITIDNVLEVFAYIKIRRRDLDWTHVKVYEFNKTFHCPRKSWTKELTKAYTYSKSLKGDSAYSKACQPYNALIGEHDAFKYCEWLIEGYDLEELAINSFNASLSGYKDGDRFNIRHLVNSLGITLIQLGGAEFLKEHPHIGVTKGKNIPFIYSVDGIFAGEPSRTLKQTLKFLSKHAGNSVSDF